MTITLPLQPHVEAELLAVAQAKALTADALVTNEEDSAHQRALGLSRALTPERIVND